MLEKTKLNSTSFQHNKLKTVASAGLQSYSSFLKNKTSVNKSLIDPSNAEMMQLSHDQINFINTDANQIYEISFSVRNVSSKSMKIKYFKPKSPYLTVNVDLEAQKELSVKKNQENSGIDNFNGAMVKSSQASLLQKNVHKDYLMVAPGLEMKFIVIYNSEVNQIIRDRVIIYSEDGNSEHQIPICVFPTVNLLSFEGFIDFGTIKLGVTKEIIVDIENKGKNVAYINFQSHLKGPNQAKINVSPTSLQILPSCIGQVAISICSKEAGEVQGTVDIYPQFITESFIEFSAIFCDSNRFITLQDGEQISEICLPPMFAGQQKKISFYLINNTPKECQYRLIRKKNDSMETKNQKSQIHKTNANIEDHEERQNYCLITPEQFGRDDQLGEKIIKFTPFEGELDSFSKREIQCEVKAKFQENDYQLFCNYAAGKIKILPYQTTQWSYSIKTYFNDEDPPKNLQIKGQSLIPKLSLSSTFFRFGEASIRKKIEKTLKIENLSDKTMHIKLEKSKNYKFNCTSVVIPENQSKQISVIFTPQICGELSQFCYLKVGEFSFPIKVFGKGVFLGNKNKVQAHKKCETQDENENDGEEDQAKGIQIDADDMDLPPQISIIRDKDKSIWADDTNNKSISYNFDTTILKSKLGKTQKPHEKMKMIVKNKNGKEVVLEANNLNPNEQIEEYPGIGRNPQQDRIVSRELTLQEFRHIAVGHVIINYGQVFVSNAQKKTFHICNLNNRPISIQLQTKNQSEFQESSKSIQVLPAESHGGISIVFKAFREGSFKFPLQYIINGRHHFQILVTGTAILPTLQLSKTDFRFIANEEDPTFEKKECLTLKNVYPYEAHFSFSSDKDSHFRISPQSGTMPPNGKKQITIFHSFFGILQGGGRIQENIKLKIKNGQKFDIKCLSIVPDAFLTCKPMEVNFKEISICKFYEMKISLRNPSKNFTIFKVIPNKDIEDLLAVQTNSTSLSSDQVAQVNFKFYCSHQMLIDSAVTIVVRGGKNITIPVKANVIIPKVKVQGDTIDFGSMPVSGNPSIKQIILANQSSIATELDLILQNDSQLAKCLSVKQESNELVTIMPVKQMKEYKVKVYTIKLAKKCKAQIFLEFVPNEVKQYNFMLPLYLSGCSDSFGTLQKNVVCRSLNDRLVIDHREIDFGKIIIEQSIEHVPKSFSISLKNPCSEEIQWEINQKALQPFSLEKTSGKLSGNQEIKLKVYLYNDSIGTFERELQFFINTIDYQSTKPYLKIIVKATANYPELYFDRPYIIMPVVRLGEQSIANFQVINGGYQNLHLKHIICQESTAVDFQVKYLAGSNLSITKKSLPIRLSFKSDKPISFTYKLDFYDHHNRVFSIYVSGTADNSLYTIPEKQWAGNFEVQIESDCQFLKNYLNSLGFVDEPLYDFPDSMIDSDYQNLQKFLSMENSFFDKMERLRTNQSHTSAVIATSVNIGQNQKQSTGGHTNSSQSYEYLNEIIKLLKAEGAFLNQIRPEFLMKESQFLEIIYNRAENNRVTQYYNLPTGEQFLLQRKKTWVIFIYQIFKVCSKVPVKKKNNDFWSQFPARQKSILQWLQQCYQSETGINQIRSANQFKDLGDGEMLSALITKYTNIKIIDSYGKNNLTYKEKEKKCKKIIDTFNQIGIICGVKAEDLLKSKPRQMLVFLQRLYMILPSYLQKGQPILFSCSVGQTVTKSVQIKNPSKFPVTYVAKIEGSKAYTIQNDQQFVIEGKKKFDLHIKYFSNIDIDKNNATLTLTGKTSSNFTPSTFIFVLKSVSLGRISQKNIQVTSQLYDPYEFEINVKNNFSTDAVFNIQIISSSQKQNKNLYCLLKNAKIKKGEAVILPFTFFPFVMQTHKYFIIFKDPKVGQFQYQLIGIVEQPQIIPQHIRIAQTFFTSKIYNIDVYVPQKNDLLVKARKQMDTNYQKMIRKNNTIGAARRSQHRLEDVNILYPILKQQTYTLSLTPQNQMITLKNNTLTFDADQEQSLSIARKLSLQINMKVPVKDGVLYLNVKNSSNTDIRKYKVIINSVYKPLKYEMQLKVPVNQSILQPLPLINISNQVNLFNVSFISSHTVISSSSTLSKSGSNNNSTHTAASNSPYIFKFTNQNQISLKAREQSTVPLTFYPRQLQQYTGLVKIENLTTGQLVEYQVIGIGEEPIAENLKFSQGTLQNKRYEIKLPFERAQRYNVTRFNLNSHSYSSNHFSSTKTPQENKIQTQQKSKIDEATKKQKQNETATNRSQKISYNVPEQVKIKYDKQFAVTSQQKSYFNFNFSCKIPGIYEGRIHIQDDIKIHAFHITVNVEETLVAEIQINTIQRVKECKKINLPAGIWKIQHNDPNIDIVNQIDLQADGQVNFSYCSIKTGEFNSSHIIFRSQQQGHLKYKLKIKIQQQPESQIDYGRVILGKKKEQIITLSNPDNFTIKVEGICNNSDLFYYCLYNEKNLMYQTMETNFQIRSKQTLKIRLIYRPTTLDEQQQGKIYFISNSNQKWKYSLKGKGCLSMPQSLNKGEQLEAFQIKQINAEVNRQMFESITFTNPFKNSVQIHVFIENQKNSEFSLIHEHNKYTLSYLQELQIPIKFKTSQVKKYTGYIKILINENIYWRYLIHANIQCNCLEDVKVLKVPSREKNQSTIQFNLPSQCNTTKQNYQCLVSPFVKNNSKKYAQEQNALKNSVRILKQWTQEEAGTKNKKCFFIFNLLSFRPYSMPVLFEIVQEDGSKWLYKGQIQFLSPPIDDHFEIITEVNKASTVAFRLSNRTKNYAKYNAHFTSDSDIQFSIHPKQGDLEPYGREGTLLEVTFAPTQYKNSWHGKIVIQTQESYWSYGVKGSLPHYSPPIGKSNITASNSRLTHMK